MRESRNLAANAAGRLRAALPVAALAALAACAGQEAPRPVTSDDAFATGKAPPMPTARSGVPGAADAPARALAGDPDGGAGDPAGDPPGASAARPANPDDPLERANRAVHGFNKGLDRVVLRPVALAYGTATPKPLRRGVTNVADTLATPGYVVNDLLQGNVRDAGGNFMRFMVNATFGLGGLMDVAGDMGIGKRPSDFGETLHEWGAGEGAYVELPVFGPSTGRDAVGVAVDLVTNPLGRVLPDPDRGAVPAAQAIAAVDNRYEYREVVDSVLYDSADSYAQARLLYLERRRHRLGGQAPGDDGADPYADPDGIDPYAQ